MWRLTDCCAKMISRTQIHAHLSGGEGSREPSAAGRRVQASACGRREPSAGESRVQARAECGVKVSAGGRKPMLWYTTRGASYITSSRLKQRPTLLKLSTVSAHLYQDLDLITPSHSRPSWSVDLKTRSIWDIRYEEGAEILEVMLSDRW